MSEKNAQKAIILR